MNEGLFKKIKGNTYYLKGTGLYLLIKEGTIKKCWREYYDDFWELSYEHVDIEHAYKALIELEIKNLEEN